MADDAHLNEFFQRPIKIAEYQWSVGDANPSWEGYIDPWTLYFANPRVVNRISNYKLLRARLHVKFLINGTQFHFGRALVSYTPAYDDFVNDINVRQYICLETQRPHVFLNPSTSEGAEMTLPFFTPLNVLDITQGDWTNMGRLFFRQLNQLKHASGADDVVNISVFAWCEDIKYAVPTQKDAFNIQPQSDEYSSRPISYAAGIVSRLATAASRFPPIRPYALATSIGADAVGKIAALFGFSKPATIDAEIMRQLTVRDMAVTNTKDDAQKLTLDVKQELTVDPRTVGLDGTDEMNINYIASKESYLDTFTWTFTEDPEELLWNAVVDPRNVLTVGTGDSQRSFLPALAFVSMPFSQWRGSLKFRFQIISSGFHKGRLKFVYDPSGTPLNGAEYNTAYTTIVDISKETDFTVCVGWGQSTSYRDCMPFPRTEFGVNPRSWTPALDYGNGTIACYIVNELAAPDPVYGDVEINVYVSACDDLEFGNPSDTPISDLKYRPFVEPQSNEVGTELTDPSTMPTHDSEIVTMGENTDISDYTNHIHFGEVVRSIRTLLKRYSFYEITPTGSDPTAGYVSNVTRRSSMPRNGGFVSISAPPNYAISGGRNYSYAQTNFLTFFTQAFAGWRGSIRHMYQAEDYIGNRTTFLVARRPTDPTDIDTTVVTQNLFAAGNAAGFYNSVMKQTGTGSGAMILHSGNNTAAVFELPYQKRFRYCPARRNLQPVLAVDGFQNGYSLTRTTLCTDQNLRMIPLKHYVAAGEDFNLFFFVGCPPVYSWDQEPT